MDTDEETIRLRRGAAVWREVEGEIIALELESSTYMAANPSGALLWKRLSEGSTRQELVADLVNEYDIDTERATADVDAFVEQCRQRGLLEP